MSEMVNSVAAPKLQSRRCLACRLPEMLRHEIERDRIRGWATFAALAEKAASKGFNLSDSALRRHFRHVPRDQYFEVIDDGDGSQDAVPTPFDQFLNADWISEKTVAEALVRTLLQRMQVLERQQRLVRDQGGRERLGQRYLQTLSALERALKRLEETRKPEREVKKVVAAALQQASAAIIDTYRAGLTDQMTTLRYSVCDLLDHKLRPEDLLGQIKRWREEWPVEMARQLGETLKLSFRAAGAEA